MPDLDHLKAIRLAELEAVLRHFPESTGKEIKVLEIGAGAGWQSHRMAALGYKVSAVEIEHSHYADAQVFPVVTYSGNALPFGDQAFDVVFSSNVLEHVTGLDQFLGETARVLKDRGRAIHVLPTPAWRMWCNALHPWWYSKRAFRTLFPPPALSMAAKAPTTSLRRAALWNAVANLAPRRHGERGNAWSEVYYFSEPYWRRRFEQAGFHTERSESAGIFYTDQETFGSGLSIYMRRKLAPVFGSACRIYVLRKTIPGARPAQRQGAPGKCAA